MPDITIELYGLRDAAALTGFNITNIRSAKPEIGLAERGVDVLFDLDGRRLGAQHTIFHSDEGQTPGKRGSAARAREEETARTTQAPFGMYGKFDFPHFGYALTRRLQSPPATTTAAWWLKLGS
jgi:hypothetical protein